MGGIPTMQSGIQVSLDIGTTSVKVIVAEFVNSELNVIGVGNAKSEGISRGVIVDIDQAAQSIKKAVNQAEEKSGVTIHEVIVGIPANGLEIEPCHGMVGVSNAGNEITNKDIQEVVETAMIKSVPPEKDILAILPQEFIVDGFDGISDPRGMIGVRLEMHALLLSSPKTILHNIRKCVDKAGYHIKELILQPLAIGSVALSAGERNFGTILVDLGGGQTTVSIFHDHQLKFSYVNQEGGEYMSKDISVVFNTAPENAERLKREYGYALVDATSEENHFPVEVIGQSNAVRVSESHLAEVLEARLVQIFEKIDDELGAIDAYKLPGGIIITGGASSLPGTTQLAKEVFGINVKMYIPEHMGIRYPSFATGIGLIEYVSRQSEIDRLISHVLKGYDAETASPLPQSTPDNIAIEQIQTKKVNKKQAGTKENGTFKKFLDQITSFFE